ncbi:ATP-binding protein [Streptomyces sp. PTM05]|uniref:ATP-binding protein n=1 Tax=Streptantibioticus parmotrematis TaxID=2873249 RepID=A0ABS7R354_9ACTN|nr:ATP-binding protein [Streptantibioticus parmotrematis]MBY8889324.1 ATP-binding protein [Streptantibioticus parmotrematis]
MPESLQQFFEARHQSVRMAREFATRAVDGWGLTSRTEDIRLCVSELATNAVVHGTARGHGFLVRLDIDDNCVRLEVHDSRRQQPVVRESAVTDISGRGLTLVAALSDEWGVKDRTPLGKVIWSCFKTAGDATQPISPPGSDRDDRPVEVP